MRAGEEVRIIKCGDSTTAQVLNLAAKSDKLGAANKVR